MTEIFIEPELETLHEDGEEWQSICQELQLNNQLAKTGKVERVGAPYMKMDPRTERLFEILCPVSTTIEEYTASTIPLDVLKEVKRCKDNQWFPMIMVWYDDKSPDPIVIGYEKDQYQGHKYMIARWGDEILPFEQLFTKAIDRLRDAYRRALSMLISDCKTRLEDVDGEIKAYINQGNRWGGFETPKFNSPFNNPGLF